MLFGKQRSSDGELKEILDTEYWFECVILMDDYSTVVGEIKNNPVFCISRTDCVRIYTDNHTIEMLIPMCRVRNIQIKKDPVSGLIRY